MNSTHQLIASLALALPAMVCRADGFVNVYEIPHNVSWNVIGNQLTHEVVNRTLHHWDIHAEQQRAERAKAGSLRRQPGRSVASQLAKGVPGAQAGSAEAAYKQAYRYHEMVIRKFGLPSGDLGVGIASGIAGAWMAYHNKSFPDQFYLPLVRQMQQRVSNSPDLKSLSAGERSAAYEGLAIAGMMLASSQITWERNPRAPGAAALQTRMRTEGAEMLTKMLRLPPDQVGIGATGFVALNAPR